MKDGKAQQPLQEIEPCDGTLEDLLDALHREATVVTGTKWLVSAILHDYEQAAVAQGLQAWPTPHILFWPIWLQNLWEEAVITDSQLERQWLLSSQQERRIWEGIIKASPAKQPLQQVSGLVLAVQEAWQLTRAWDIDLQEESFRYNHDSAAFFRWASKFEDRCLDQHWLSLGCLTEALQGSLQPGRVSVPDELLLVGFDFLTPQQQRLLGTLLDAGTRVRWLQLQGKAGHAVGTSFQNTHLEAAGMARWARRRLDENPAARIGVAVPEFATHRKIVSRALDEMLVPQAIHPGIQPDTSPYTLSLGLPLSTYPIVQTALELLGMLNKVVSVEAVRQLLLSPFISGWETEAGPRALLDIQVRSAGEMEVSPGRLRYLASQTGKPWFCPLLSEGLGRWAHAAQDLHDSASPGQWSEQFARVLEAVGWAQGRSLSSEEFQGTQAWRELLVELASLEPVTGLMPHQDAVALLGDMARERLFQPQAEWGPVQVLGLHQASWFQFDHLWIMGLHDGIWPPAPRPNPFVPRPVQRALGLPCSSEEAALQAARRATRRLLTGADEVVVSHAQKNGDEVLRASPLVSGLPVVDSGSLPGSSQSTWREKVHASARQDLLINDPAPPLQAHHAKGGSNVFKLQAACPFRAFAELRLDARPVRQVGIGLDAMMRGSLLHRVMEKVWGALECHERLAAIDAGQLRNLIAEQVTEAVEKEARRYPHTFKKRFRKIEEERLSTQVYRWLENEKLRKPFQVVERETSYEVSFGKLVVRLRIDRLDALKDGRHLVIDYKTGKTSTSQWFGSRPNEPQLLLYSVAVDRNVAGLLFAQIREGDMRFKGISDDADMIEGVSGWYEHKELRTAESWPEVLQHWRATLTVLADAFCEGVAAVQPKRYPSTCRHCELGPLCRIDELKSMQAEFASE